MGTVLKWGAIATFVALSIWAVAAFWRTSEPSGGAASATAASQSSAVAPSIAASVRREVIELPLLVTPSALRGAVVIIPPENRDRNGADQPGALTIPAMLTPDGQGVAIVPPTVTPAPPTSTPSSTATATPVPPTPTPTPTRDVRATATAPLAIHLAPSLQAASSATVAATQSTVAIGLATSTATPTPQTLAALSDGASPAGDAGFQQVDDTMVEIPLLTPTQMSNSLTVAIQDAPLYASSDPGFIVVGKVVTGQVLEIVGRHVEGQWYMLGGGAWIQASLVANPPAQLPLLFPTSTPLPTATPIPTATAVSTVTPTPSPTGTPQPTPLSVVVCDCNADIYTCYNYDFARQADAQACYEYCFRIVAWDIHGLDPDTDGQACEDLR